MPIPKCERGLLENGTCMINGEYCLKFRCQFDSYDEEEGSCWECTNLDDVDGSSAEFASPIYVCTENPGYGNLLSFPFKKEKECFVLSGMYS